MLPYTVREAIAAFRRTPLLTGLSATMVGLALFVVGLFGLAAHNLHFALQTVEERVEVVAFIRDGTSEGIILEAQKELRDLEGVAEVRYVTKQEALETARNELPEIGQLSGGLEVNPFPASLELELMEGYRSPDRVETVAEDVEVLPFVEEVRYGQEWVDKLFLLRRIAGVTAAVIGGAFAVVAALIIGTAIRIAVFARRDEIHIMRLVGATHGLIRGPFLLEGAFTGLLGAFLATLLTWTSYWTVNRFLFEVEWIPREWIGVGILGGIAFGVLASGLAVRRHLEEV